MNPPSFPPSRKKKFRPDYHAGADETALMWEFYPDAVDTARAKRLKPQSSPDFEPLGYVGDPASFELEKNAKETFLIMVEHTALVIETFLKNKDGLK